MKLILILSILKFLIIISEQHGRLEVPASRNTAWRFGYNTPSNYDDAALNCGGYYVLWELNRN